MAVTVPLQVVELDLIDGSGVSTGPRFLTGLGEFQQTLIISKILFFIKLRHTDTYKRDIRKMQMAQEGPDYFSDLIPRTKNGDKGASSAAFAEDAVLMSAALDGTRLSADKKTASMPGTPMVSVSDRCFKKHIYRLYIFATDSVYFSLHL